MADGGRYRRRRHGAFDVRGPAVARKAHQPHFQSRDYNPLNGNVQRWFEPIEPVIAYSPVLTAIFQALTPLFAVLDGRETNAPWHAEVHQFRIETSLDETGRPTPEAVHRDGVDWVVVMLIDRRNVADGTTQIEAPDGAPLGQFTLRTPGDAVVLDDRRILHGVTPLQIAEPGTPSYRDALVMTWRAER
jgi:hypothetical protein